MTIIVFFLLIVLGILFFPMLIPFLLTGYMALDGLASRNFIYHLNVSVGGTNIFLLDLLYAAAIFLTAFGFMRLVSSGKLKRYAPLTKTAMILVLLYFVFFFAKLVSGYFDGVPADSLIRRFSGETQCVYMFVPLFFIKEERMLQRLLYFVLLLTLLFPLFQPLLYGSADQIYLSKGQGTLRLGFGNANLLLMLGVLILFVWERKLWLSAIPLAGVAMLAQRSAFIALTLCVMVLSFQKKKSTKFIALIGLAGMLFVAALVVIQATTSIPVVDKAVERFSQTFKSTGTTTARLNVIPMAMEQFAKRPLAGFSYHETHVLKQMQDEDAFAFNMLHPHNFVLSSILRSGIIGTLLLFTIIYIALFSSLRLTRKSVYKKQGMYLFSTILFFVVFGLMNTSFFSAGYVFWTLLGITFWYLNQSYAAQFEPQQQDQVIEEDSADQKTSRLLRSKKSL